MTKSPTMMIEPKDIEMLANGLRSIYDRPLTLIESRLKATESNSRESHVLYARWACRHSFLSGEWPFASHLLYPRFMDDSDQIERNTGISFQLSLIRVAVAVVFYIDLGFSSGMEASMDHCRKHHVLTRQRFLPKPMLDAWRAGIEPPHTLGA